MESLPDQRMSFAAQKREFLNATFKICASFDGSDYATKTLFDARMRTYKVDVVSVQTKSAIICGNVVSSPCFSP